MTMKIPLLAVCLTMALVTIATADDARGFLPGERVLMEAHNCYPYQGRWSNRIDRALEAGFPLGIEIDLCWHAEGDGGKGRLVVAHEGPFTGEEPLFRDYFFERVRADVEKALASGNKRDWPLITLNINDIRGEDEKMHPAVWALTGEYESWLCTAVKGPESDPVAAIDVKPVLVLSGGGPREVAHFYDSVPVGGKLRIFGSGREGVPADNFRRWINYSWKEVEPEGQPRAGDWTAEDAERLDALVKEAHQQGYWIRFYSLDGNNPIAHISLGISPGYNFGSLEAVQARWKAAIGAGVDFIATDQCREAVAFMKSLHGAGTAETE